jgi:hypothetical protein
MADTTPETDPTRAGGDPTPVLPLSDQRAAETRAKTEGANLDVEVHTPHAHRTGHHWIDMTVALAAVFISVVSLAVAILHGRTMERMAEENARLVAANSWPFLQYAAGWATANGVTRLSIKVFNSGVGPAKIESAELVWKGVAYRSDREFLEACCGFDPASGTPFDSDGFLGYVLRAGIEVRFLEFSKTANPAVFAALQQVVLSRDLQLNVCYCSIFDECWQSDLVRLSLKPKQVEACTLPKVSFDQGISTGKQ